MLQIDTPIESEADVESDTTSLDAAPSPEKGFKGKTILLSIAQINWSDYLFIRLSVRPDIS